MLASNRFGFSHPLAIPLVIACWFFLAAIPTCWSDPPAEVTDESIDVAGTGSDHRAESGDVAELGVMVVDSPGAGVLVTSVLAGSPAEVAGVRSGDFIVAIDSNPVQNPSDLSSVIQAKSVNSTVTVDVWRNGKQVTKSVPLAAAETSIGRHRRAWLGVELAVADPDGARIALVVPDSPAAHAKLHPGDVVTAVGDKPIRNVNDLIDSINEQNPGAIITLTVTREGNELAFKVKLASVGDAPMFSFRVPYSGEPMMSVPPPVQPNSAPGRWRPWSQEIQELKSELAQIREQLRQLTEQQTAPSNEASDEESDASPSDDESVPLPQLPR